MGSEYGFSSLMKQKIKGENCVSFASPDFLFSFSVMKCLRSKLFWICINCILTCV